MNILVLVALLAVAYAEEEIRILRNERNINPDGSFIYFYETANGISVSEHGSIKNAGTDDEALEVEGEYSYEAPDGQIIQIKYVAGPNGFQPQGAHLPQSPEVPKHIQRAHLPKLPEVPEQRAHLPQSPDFPEERAHLPQSTEVPEERADLPQSTEVPEDIQSALQYSAEDPEEDDLDQTL